MRALQKETGAKRVDKVGKGFNTPAEVLNKMNEVRVKEGGACSIWPFVHHMKPALNLRVDPVVHMVVPPRCSPHISASPPFLISTEHIWGRG